MLHVATACHADKDNKVIRLANLTSFNGTGDLEFLAAG